MGSHSYAVGGCASARRLPTSESQRAQIAQRMHEDVTSNGKEIASAVRQALAERVGSPDVELWFSDVEFQVQDGQLCIRVQHVFQAERLRRRFAGELQQIWQQLSGRESAVIFEVSTATTASLASIAATEAAEAPAQVASKLVMDKRVSEGVQFIVGEEHRVILASLEVVLARPGKITPLYIHGPTGCGKTEFLAYVRTQARVQAGLRRIVSVSAEQFTTDFLEALNGRGVPSFRRKFRDVELLLIDDLQFFSGKKQTLIELQNTIDALLRAGRQLVLAADRPPFQLHDFSPALVARISSGLVWSLPYPGRETRREIARRTAERFGGLSEELLDLIAGQFDRDARQVIGAVYRLVAHSRVLHRMPTVEEAHAALQDLLFHQKRPVGLPEIESAVCTVLGIDRRRLHTEGRDRSATQPRMLAMWLARKYTRAGLSEIGRFFGRRSHSTVVGAQRQVERWLANGSLVRAAHGELPIQEALRRIESQLRTA